MGVILGISGLAGAGKDTVADLLVNEFSFVKIAFADPIKRAAMDWWDFSEEQLWGPSEMRNKPDKRYRIGGLNRDSIVGQEDARCFAHLDVASNNGKLPEGFDSFEDLVEDQFDKYLTPRMALQQIGTEIARSLDKEVWLRYGLKVARQLLQRPGELNYKRTVGVVEEKREAPIVGVVISDARFANELVHIGERGKIARIKRPGAGLSGDAAKHASETEHQLWSDDIFDYILDNNGTIDDLADKVSNMVDHLVDIPKQSSKQLELF